MDLEKKLTEIHGAFDEFKRTNDATIKEIKDRGFASAEKLAKVEELNTVISKLEGDMKSMQAALARGAQGAGETEQEQKSKKHSEALAKYLKKGNETELKAMSVDVDEDGGFLVTPQMSSDIVKKVYESSPMRQLSSVQTISTDALEILQDLDEAGAEWVGETQTRSETDTPKLKKIVIPVHELSAMPKATQKLLDDASLNVESWLAEKVSERFARKEETAFVSGNGVTQPKGILSYDEGTGFDQIERVETAGSLVIAADDLINLHYSLKGAYKQGAAWLAQRDVIKLFRKLKDSQNRYLWEPGLNGASQATILGNPIYEAADMQASGVAANVPVAFGNFKQGYQIVDRIGIRVIRDIFSSKPHVLFYTTKRVGGAVKNFEAIKLLKVKA